MKASLVFCAIFFVVLAFVAEANADGGEVEGGPWGFLQIFPPGIKRGNRQRRVTCDLMSPSTPWGSFGHSLCAAHCLAMMKGFRGGYCENGVCHCRK